MKIIVGILLISLIMLAGKTYSQQMVDAKEWPTGSYKKYETFTIKDLTDFKPDAYTVTLSKYGGRSDRKFEKTGFFHVKKLPERWIMVDPDGYEYFQVGCNAVVSDYYAEKYATKDQWAEATTEWFKSNGFNVYGLWSDQKEFNQHPMPYTIWVFFMGGYMNSKGTPINQISHDDRQKLALPVFDPGFVTFCSTQAQNYLQSTVNDPYLVGIFSDNELPFNENSLDLYLDLPPSDPNYIAAKEWMQKKGYTITSSPYSAVMNEEFLFHVVDTYYRITKNAIRSIDVNHLFMGCRHIAKKMNVAAIWRASKDYVDIVSQNVYKEWTPGKSMMDMWQNESGHPFMVTEFYAKGQDTGMPNTSGAGWVVKTQNDRGLFYEHFTMALMKHPACVGFHWYRYIDDNVGANQTNRGIFDLELNPYTEMVNHMKLINTNVYEIRDYLLGVEQEPTGLNKKKYENNSDFQLFPNPTEGKFYVKTNNLNDTSLTVFTINGQKVYETNFQGNTNINLPSKMNGIFLVKVENSGETITQRIVIR